MAVSTTMLAMYVYRVVVIMGTSGWVNVLTAQDTFEGWLIPFANTHKLVHRGHGFEPKKSSRVIHPGCLLADAIENYFFLFTAALKAAPALKRGTVAAAIFSFSPVRGFLPTRAARLAALNVPKPMSCTSCFLATVLVMISTTALNARPAAALDMSVSLANASINSALFKIFSKLIERRDFATQRLVPVNFLSISSS
jgi:hypothetical protein